MAMLPTSQLKAGDVIDFYGATYRLREDARKVYQYINWADIPYYGAKGDLLQGSDFISAKEWWFQGNDSVSWHVIERS